MINVVHFDDMNGNSSTCNLMSAETSFEKRLIRDTMLSVNERMNLSKFKLKQEDISSDGESKRPRNLFVRYYQISFLSKHHPEDISFVWNSLVSNKFSKTSNLKRFFFKVTSADTSFENEIKHSDVVLAKEDLELHFYKHEQEEC